MDAKIKLLHPRVRDEVQRLFDEINRNVLKGSAKMLITSTLRTFEEQANLYAQGRTAKGKKVTNANAGQSIHNYGLAFDFALIVDGKRAEWNTVKDYDGDAIADWMEIVRLFESHGWKWGGRFKSIVDMPHFEKTFGNTWRTLIEKPKDKDGYVVL